MIFVIFQFVIYNLTGEYCEIVLEQPCPAGWWGVGECGPCNCDVDKGYNPDCHKTTGECSCNVSL